MICLSCLLSRYKSLLNSLISVTDGRFQLHKVYFGALYLACRVCIYAKHWAGGLFKPKTFQRRYKEQLSCLAAASCSLQLVCIISFFYNESLFYSKENKQSLTTSTICGLLTSTATMSPPCCDTPIVPPPPPPLSNWSVAGMSDEPVFGLTTEMGC